MRLRLLRSATTSALLLSLLAACGDQRRPAPVQGSPEPAYRPAPSPSSPGGESETRIAGFGTVTEDTYLVQRQTDRNGLIRAVLTPDPDSKDVDTFQARLSRGEHTMHIKKGTRVGLRSEVTVNTLDGRSFKFLKIEVVDGSLVDHRGDPVRGSVLATAVKLDP